MDCSMQNKQNEFERDKVWILVPRPNDQIIIGTKQVFRKKCNENGKVVRYKARLLQNVIIKKNVSIMKKPLHLLLY